MTVTLRIIFIGITPCIVAAHILAGRPQRNLCLAVSLQDACRQSDWCYKNYTQCFHIGRSLIPKGVNITNNSIRALTTLSIPAPGPSDLVQKDG